LISNLENTIKVSTIINNATYSFYIKSFNKLDVTIEAAIDTTHATSYKWFVVNIFMILPPAKN